MPALTALIPLDGTKLSESAFSLLPLIQKLGFDRVVLVTVWESLWPSESLGRGNTELKELEEKARAYLHAYLGTQADRVKRLGFSVETDLRVGRPADEVLHAASQISADLIIIATHGREGIARWRLGSIADKVVRHAESPTLVIGPNVKIDLAPYSLRRILVPLDGSTLAEEALPVATWMARTAGAELDLARVVSLIVPDFELSYSVDILTEVENAARSYLARVAGTLSGKVQTRTELLIGTAAEQLLAHMKEAPAELVVMASHGRSGVIRAALGSVADRMLHGPAPVLVLRPEQTKSGLVEAAAQRRRGDDADRVAPR